MFLLARRGAVFRCSRVSLVPSLSQWLLPRNGEERNLEEMFES